VREGLRRLVRQRLHLRPSSTGQRCGDGVRLELVSPMQPMPADERLQLPRCDQRVVKVLRMWSRYGGDRADRESNASGAEGEAARKERPREWWVAPAVVGKTRPHETMPFPLSSLVQGLGEA